MFQSLYWGETCAHIICKTQYIISTHRELSLKGGINMKEDDQNEKQNNDHEDTILKINANGSDECILIFKEGVSVETVVNALMTALYSVSSGLEGNDNAFALHVAEEYLAFVKRKTVTSKGSKKTKKSTLKLLSMISTKSSEQFIHPTGNPTGGSC